MNVFQHLRSRAGKLWRALWPVAVVVGGAVTCDNPMAPRPAAIAIAPVLDLQGLRQFAGLSVDQVRITIIRPPSDTIVNRRVWPFSLDADSFDIQVSVEVSGTEDLDVIFELLSTGSVIFTGAQTVTVTEGAPPPAPTPITPTYTGPGSNIATLLIQPRDSGAAFGATVPFRIAAFDSSANPVASFYVGWNSSDPAHSINAAGIFTAGNARGVVWIKAHTPTGIWDSTRITVAPVPTAVQVVSGSGQSGSTGAQLSNQLVARVIAQDNGPVVGIPVTFAAASGGGSVNPATVVTDAQGQAATTATLGATAGANTFTATVSGLAAATFTGTATTAGPPALAFTVQPATAVAGSVIAPAVEVSARDGGGSVLTSFTGNITVAIGSNPGGGVLLGTVTAPAVSGVATFGNLSIDKSGTGYTLTASAATLTSATSTGFNINAGPAATLALVSGGGQAGTPGTQLPQPIIVSVTDALGNGVSGHAVTFAVASGGGSVGTPSATTNASGQAQTTWTLGAGTGAQSITATATGLTGSPITIPGTGASTGSTTVSPQFDTLTAINGTRTLVAQARDTANNPVTGSFTWVSRDPTIATVSGTGLVTAVANGETYIVATEAGGTRDSSRIVVQQRIATINVTPGNRSIYLTGTFQFNATAVDGLGTPLAGTPPTFTWSSTAPAVATVNTSGFVTSTGLGSTQIRATFGTVTGVSNVSVITPITRIAVVVDTVGAATTDTFTLTSLGLPRNYRAIAHDTLDAVMPGISFTWVSSNGSVAVLSNVTTTTATATSAANGVTSIRASAQGFTSAPGAALTVAQVLASIELSPTTAVIAVTGTTSLLARGKDANNRYISGGTFAYGSSDLAVATVGASTGVVTGVANGTANITATAAAITSNNSVVTVGGVVPAVISFGRDTVSVGRGSTASIPVYLSTPYGSDLTVFLSVADTFAFWSTASITIPAGATAANATLNGRNAGTTTVSATDTSAAGYVTANAVAKVTANMRLTSSGYAINATDIVQTQILLSDPSPAGGTYVTFGYSTPGIAAISPDPAFIPTGQLAADIQIRGLAAGSTTIMPSATGVNGQSSSFTAYAPVLTGSTTTIRLGSGQYEPSFYVYTPTNGNLAVPVTITSSDTSVVTVPALATIPGGSYYVYFPVTAKGTGTATVTMTAPGWTAATLNVIATSPRVDLGGGGALFTTSPQQNVTAYTTDSLYSIHYRTNSLVVRLSSSDTTIMKVLDTLVTVAPGTYYTSAGRVIPAGLVGSAWIVASASGHAADSVQYTVDGPPLAFSWASARIGAGQYDQNVYVYTPNSVTSPLTVTIANTDSSFAAAPVSVTIPTGLYYAYFNVRGKTPGTSTFTATAPGYNAANATYTVTSPRVDISGGGTINNFAPGQNYTVYVADSVGTVHYLTDSLVVVLASSDTFVIATDTIAVIPAGQYYTSTPMRTAVGLGTAQILAVAAGHFADSVSYAVVTPKLNISFNSYVIGRRQHQAPNDFYVYTPDNRTTPLAVTLTQANAAADSLSATALTITPGLYYAYFTLAGLATGVDTVIATAAGYLPDTAVVIVSTPRLLASGLPGSFTTTSPAYQTTVYTADSVGNTHYSLDTLVVAAVPSDSTVIQPAQPFFRILRGAAYAQPFVNIVGPGTASMTFSDSAGTGYLPVTTNVTTVTGPSLGIANGSPMLGMRQHGGVNSSYVTVPNTVQAPLLVTLLSTDTRVATVPASVTIQPGFYYAYFDITAQDTVGTIQIQATATGYQAASTNVQVTVPRITISGSTQLNTTSQPTVLTIYAADANGTTHYTTEDVVVNLLSSAPGVATIDSTQVTIVSGGYYTQAARWAPAGVGSAQLQASDQRAVQYAYGMGTLNVSVITPQVSLGIAGMLGIGQYDDYQSISVPDNVSAPLDISIGHATTARVSTAVNLSNTPISGVTIPTGIYYQYFRMAGISIGTDTLSVSASQVPHVPDSAVVVVTQGRIDPISGWPASLAVGDSVLITIYARDANTTTHNVVAATPFTLAPNANIEFRSGGSVITQATIPADAYYVQFYVKALASGSGSVTITATDYVPYSNTVTIP